MMIVGKFIVRFIAGALYTLFFGVVIGFSIAVWDLVFRRMGWW